MSKAAEDAYERWAAQHDADCARDLVIGAKVYRVEDHGATVHVEDGEIVEVGTGWYDDRGHLIRIRGDDKYSQPPTSPRWPSREIPKVYATYTANFKRIDVDDSMTDTGQRQFFFNKLHAHHATAQKVKRYIEELEYDLAKSKAKMEEQLTLSEGQRMPNAYW